MPIYKVMPYDGTPERENEFNRMEKGPSLLFEITLPLRPNEMLGNRVIFEHDGQWWVKTAQMANHSNSLIGFPRYFLFARPAAKIEDEIKCARDREAGLIQIAGMEVIRLL